MSRLRHVKSTNDCETIAEEATIHKQNAPDKPVHVMIDSLFSVSSGFTNFRGFFNLAMIILFIAVFRVGLENLLRYGILMDPFWFFPTWQLIKNEAHNLFYFFLMGICCAFTVILEKLCSHFTSIEVEQQSKKHDGSGGGGGGDLNNEMATGNASNLLTENVMFALHAFNIGFMCLILPGTLITYFHPNIAISALVTNMNVLLFLKLFSYVHVNYWCRHEFKSGNAKFVGLPPSVDSSEEDDNPGKPGHSTSDATAADTEINSPADNNKHSKEEIQRRIAKYGGDLYKCTSSSKRRNPERTRNALDLATSEHSASGDATASAPKSLPKYQQNRDYHQHSKYVNYPDNLTWSSFTYFLLAPTLCYELNYPRSLTIRKRFLLRRLLELIILPEVLVMLSQQWILPLLKNSVKPFSEQNLMHISERVMKLAIPNHLLWLMCFYLLFHSFLNFSAELLRFGDRMFYLDWWNSTDIMVFWKTWNIPVHRWCARHLFKPMRIRKYSSLSASIFVFFVSAVFHEWLICIPLGMFRLYIFMGMLLQIPMAVFVSTILKNHPQMGNIVLWLSLILLQPTGAIMYFHDYYVLYVSTTNSTKLN